MKMYTPTIGLEVHAELKTDTKMFCGSRNDPHNEKPNSQVCPICMGHPGTLPVINKAAVKHVLMVGLAVQGTIATYTEFDRKNYFYPDIPKGYQISQYAYPLVSSGSLAEVAITRVHLEEDTARSLHDQGEGSIIDFNRAGVPLMELVTEPVIHDAKTASNFARELQLLLRTLSVSDANMEKGEMRVEANISLSQTNILGTKVEIKNLNSFKAVENAIAYEIKRQAEVLDRGESVVQETRGWDEIKGKTFSQRSKESAHDYRYFPDPDLPNLLLTEIPEFSISRLKDILPELPTEKRLKYEKHGIPREQIELIIADSRIDIFVQRILSDANSVDSIVRRSVNYLFTDLLPVTDVSDLENAFSSNFVALMSLLEREHITSRVAKNILVEVVISGIDPLQIIEEQGLVQTNTEEALLTVVSEVILQNPAVVADYKGGKESALQFLVGQSMKKTRGSANPKTLLELFRKTLD